MDPTGIGRAILSAIGIAYLGLAVICLLIAAFIPRPIGAKTFWVVVVVAAFGYLPASAIFRSKSDANTFSESCTEAKVQITPTEVGNGYYVAREFVRMGFSRSTSADDLFRHLLENKLAYLETDHDYQDWYGFGQLSRSNFGHPYVRLSIQPKGSSLCAAFEERMTEYPAQRWPWMRKLGLTDSLCIGLEGVNAIQSRFQVRLIEKVGLLHHEQGGGLWRYQFQLKDASQPEPLGQITSAVSRAYEHRDILCNKKGDFDKFKSEIKFSPDPRYPSITELTVNPGGFPETREATEPDLKPLRQAGNVQREYATNLIAPTRNIWFETQYRKTDSSGSISLDGYLLVSLVNNKLTKTFLELNQKPINDFTGLAVSEKTVQFIAFDRQKGIRHLLEYSISGQPLRALTLSSEQWRSFERK